MCFRGPPSAKAVDRMRFIVEWLENFKQIRSVHQLPNCGREVEKLELSATILYDNIRRYQLSQTLRAN